MNKFLFLTLALGCLTTLPVAAQQEATHELVAKPALQKADRHSAQPQKVQLRKLRHAAPSADFNFFEGRTFYGNLVNSSDWSGASIGSVPYGVYSYTFGDNADFQSIATDLTYNFMSSAFGRDQLIGAFPMSVMGALNGVRYISLDSAAFAKNWENVLGNVSYGAIPDVMAYDPTSNTYYAAMYNDELNGLNWAKFNMVTRLFDVISKWNNDFQPMTMAFTPEGEAYCIGADGYYYHLDKSNGDAEMLGETGISPTNYVQAMGYDGKTGTFIWAAVTTTGNELYTVDPESGEASLITSLNKNEQLSSLFFKVNEALDKAPAAVSGLTYSFTGTAATEGNILFNIPTTTYDGSALTGNVEMTVWMDGEQLKQESVTPGSQQSIAVSLTNDNHYVDVILKNDAGVSPNSYLYQWVGNDTPVQPTDVVLKADSANNRFALTWTAPDTGVNKGYINKEELTYDIVRMPDSVTVAQTLSGNSFTEPLPSKLERYSYRVYAENAGKRSEYAESNKVLYGDAYTVPYAEDFSTDETQPLFTINDANSDDITWEYNSYNQQMGINTTAFTIVDSCDDWLITPGIQLETGKAYALNYNMRNTFRGYWERAKVYIGTNPQDLNTFKLYASYDSIEVDGTLTDFETDFSVEESGTYYMALRCTTPKGKGSSLFLNKIRVEELGALGAPAAAESLSLTPDIDGEMIDTLRFVTPSKTLDGTALTGELTANIYRDNAAEPLTSLTGLAAGQQVSYVDNTVTGVGDHTYTVGVENEAGEGKRASVTAFIGVYKPTYTNTFDTEDDASRFVTYIDGQLADPYDGNTWKWSSWDKNLSLSYFVATAPSTSTVFFPAIKFDAESVYALSFVWNNSVYGDAQCPAEMGISRANDMTADLTKTGEMPKTSYGANLLVSSDLVSSEAGKYYPYVQITADVDNTYLMPNLDSVVIKYVTSAYAPYRVENLKVDHDASGALKATLTFNAPTKDFAGRDLTENLDINIYRGANATLPVKTFSGVEPGASLTWEDDEPVRGYNYYMIVPTNSKGRGKEVLDSTYVGVDIPVAVGNFKGKGSADNTGYELSWEAPTIGIHGGVLDSSLGYIIAEYHLEETEDSLKLTVIASTKDLTYSADNIETNTQAVHYYVVIPYTSAGYDQVSICALVLGKPYELPFEESFPNGAETTNVWLIGSTNSSYGNWTELQDGEEFQSQDGDNGMAFFYNGSYYESAVSGTLTTPKFRPSSESNYLSFWMQQGLSLNYTHPASLLVKVNYEDGDYVDVSDTILVTDSTAGWHLHRIELPQIAGKNYATVSFEAICSGMNDRVVIDNVVISSPVADAISTVNMDGINLDKAKIYDLQGRRLRRSDISRGGVYIIKEGNKVRKISHR
ncbi:MAG: choice-of-anchor J domain-containing protein [Prevotella sp.]|jgi:hypothetical protein